MKEKIAKWYKQGLWTAQMVQDAVTKKKLTADEAAEILAADGGTVCSPFDSGILLSTGKDATVLDVIESQVTYTAMMTDTLLEE